MRELVGVMQAGTHCDQPGDVLISQALRDQQFYDRLVNAFSTRAYLPSVHVPTEHDAFFATFARFGAASGSHFADMMIDQLRQSTVEINLTSNDKILGVRGKDHPLPAYLAAGVPVVLSTDDPGVSRINLANEYFRAARDYGLDYRALKAIARNALIRAFLDDAQRRSELERFDQSSAEFERSMAGTRSRQENLAALIRAALVPAL
jgi:hypothetical protein